MELACRRTGDFRGGIRDMTLATILLIIATVLLGVAVYQSQRSPTAWAFFLVAVALFIVPLIR